MFKDTPDKIYLLIIMAASLAIVILLGINQGGGWKKRSVAGIDKAIEREMAYGARVELINKLYGPVEELRKQRDNQAALLKLDELVRNYPAEAHGYILQGGILKEMGAIEEAVNSYFTGIKLNGDYIDLKSPLNRRIEIERIVLEGSRIFGEKAAANPGNRTVSASLQKLNYLKSRLAGGCE